MTKSDNFPSIPMIRWIFRCLCAFPYLGFGGSLKLFFASRRAGDYNITPRGYRHPLRVRGLTSDPVLLYNIFCAGGYAVVNLPEIRTVIDAGANVGYFSVFAAHHYPQARILSIEPEETNYAMLCGNVRSYPQVVPLHAGLWSAEGVVEIEDPTAEKWCFKCVVSDSGQGEAKHGIRAVTVGSLQQDYNMPGIDILKIDIEGGEKEVFSAQDTSWLQNVKILMCELHPGCWRSFFEALKPYQYDCRQVGENIVVLMHEQSKRSGLLSKAGFR